MKKHFITAVLYTVTTTIVLGLLYPLAITGVAQLLFRDKADGQLIQRDGAVVGSRIIGQPFTGPAYFHSRPSAAGDGYNATNSGGSNLGPTNRKLVDRVRTGAATLQNENPSAAIPADLVEASASGLDPDITPAAAYFQVPRIARERNIPEDQLRELVRHHIRGRQFGIFGEPAVNVLELNLDLASTRK